MGGQEDAWDADGQASIGREVGSELGQDFDLRTLFRIISPIGIIEGNEPATDARLGCPSSEGSAPNGIGMGDAGTVVVPKDGG